ncbi:hypothetical protein TWF694_011049 [Orbilia ellipsospora]|uniref:Gag-pol polyprotein n=1 Tax=Orbilia ellipsospora TaxID=2528407 RepID=A0AAV9X908_9PEZI
MDLEHVLANLHQLTASLAFSSASNVASAEKDFEALINLIHRIENTVKDAESFTRSTSRAYTAGGRNLNVRRNTKDLEFQYAAKATEAATASANAAAAAADAATEAARGVDGRVPERAVSAAFRAAGAAYRAAAAARNAVTSAQTLPSDAYQQYEADVAAEFSKARQKLENLYKLLFEEQPELGLDSVLFLKLSNVGRHGLMISISAKWDELLAFLLKIQDIEIDDPIEDLLGLVSNITALLKDLTRLHLVKSTVFHDSGFLARASQDTFQLGVELGLDLDASLRARSLQKLPGLFEQVGGASGGALAEENSYAVASGKVPQELKNEFLTFPGKLNGSPIKPLIDTGGSLNIVKREWLDEQKIPIGTPVRYSSVLMADGSVSTKKPIIEVKWSFDAQKTIWTDVEFMVMEDYSKDALIGLPFLRHTQMIHNGQGDLTFSEFGNIHSDPDAVPIYDTFETAAES